LRDKGGDYMFELKKNSFYLIECEGMNDTDRKALKAELIYNDIKCEVIGRRLSVHKFN